MTRGEYKLVRAKLEMIEQELASPSLSDESRTLLQQGATALARHLASVWVPFEWASRFWMLTWITVGIGGVALRGHPLFLAGWLLAAVCSPRIMSRVSDALVRIAESF